MGYGGNMPTEDYGGNATENSEGFTRLELPRRIDLPRHRAPSDWTPRPAQSRAPLGNRGAEDLLSEADHLDGKAREWRELAEDAVTDNTRRKCLWNENQCRKAAVRRWTEAQAILNPQEAPEFMRVGGVEVDLSEEDYSDYELPERIKDLLGGDAVEWV
jgi:hypothetical protein